MPRVYVVNDGFKYYYPCSKSAKYVRQSFVQWQIYALLNCMFDLRVNARSSYRSSILRLNFDPEIELNSYDRTAIFT